MASSYVVHVKKGIVIASIDVVEKPGFIENNQITHVINCTKTHDETEIEGVKYLTFQWQPYDSVNFETDSYNERTVNEITQFVDEAEIDDGIVCIHGASHHTNIVRNEKEYNTTFSQAKALCIAYLMNKYWWSLEKAIEFINFKNMSGGSFNVHNSLASDHYEQLLQLDNRLYKKHTKYDKKKTEERYHAGNWQLTAFTTEKELLERDDHNVLCSEYLEYQHSTKKFSLPLDIDPNSKRFQKISRSNEKEHRQKLMAKKAFLKKKNKLFNDEKSGRFFNNNEIDDDGDSETDSDLDSDISSISDDEFEELESTMGMGNNHNSDNNYFSNDLTNNHFNFNAQAAPKGSVGHSTLSYSYEEARRKIEDSNRAYENIIEDKGELFDGMNNYLLDQHYERQKKALQSKNQKNSDYINDSNKNKNNSMQRLSNGQMLNKKKLSGNKTRFASPESFTPTSLKENSIKNTKEKESSENKNKFDDELPSYFSYCKFMETLQIACSFGDKK